FGPLSTDLPRQPHEPSRWMRVPIELLVLACLVVGIVPAWSIGTVLGAAAGPVVGGPLPAYSLAVWHGFNAPLMMSLVAMAGGIGLYLMLRQRLERGAYTGAPLVDRLDGRRLFEHTLAGASHLARRALRLLGTRRLQPQLFLMVLVAVLAAAFALRSEGLSWGDRPRVPAAPAFALLWLIGGACALGVAVQAKYHRLAALTMLAVTGLVICLTFVWFSAPDLALTQLAVEVVTTVLFLLGLRWLPKRIAQAVDDSRVARLRRARDAVLALCAGVGLTALAYAMLTRPAPQSISPFFLDRALPEGGGSNVVNVMLVDFRGIDTMGEITVLGAVALTVYALLRRFRPPRESIGLPRQQRIVSTDRATDLVNPRTAFDTALGYLLVPAVLVRLLLPIAGVVAVYLFLRGHNEPGGGFVAGLVVAVALITQYMVAGTSWVEARLKVYPARWISVGLLFAVLTGLGALLFGYPFLTTHTAHLTLPLFGDVHIASAMFFDVGVFAAVVGATLLILTALAHQSLRSQRRPSGDAVPEPR
ncbi:MAG: hydrogen gas-evolving membrane-bound hydrogenase subunit E, partial [Caldimonas sp.]